MSAIKSASWAVFFGFCVLLLTEFGVRACSSVQPTGISKNLIKIDSSGEFVGNNPSTKAKAFGTTVYTDEHGNRVSKKRFKEQKESQDQRIVIVGDSVGFGVGVGYEKSFQGIIEKTNPEMTVDNKSVIGFDITKYPGVFEDLLKRDLSTTSAIFLIFCLNDISARSASQFSETKRFNSDGGQRVVMRLFETIPLARSINSFLNMNSRFYVLLKGLTTNPSERHFLQDRALYESLSEQEIGAILEPISTFQKEIGARGIRFLVFLVPYQYQVKNDDDFSDLPNAKLTRFYASNNVAFIDATDVFRESETNSEDLYLPYDPMHLSPMGHSLLANIIQQEIESDVMK